MGSLAPRELTQLLLDWSNGDESALDKLVPLVYEKLRRLASLYMRRESPGHTLQTSALVNEAYLKLVDYKDIRWQNRAQFFGICAQLMRRILVDHARSHRTAKRGRSTLRISLDEAAEVSDQPTADLIVLDDALTSLAAFDQRKSRIVELRFFGGLNTEEAAEVMGISQSTVEREWPKAKAWLYKAVTSDQPKVTSDK